MSVTTVSRDTMAWVKTIRLLIFLTPLLCGASGQTRPATPRSNSGAAPQNSKVHDRNWLKQQVRRRYGTSAVPEKSDPQPGDKKPATDDKGKQPPAKS
jgi:hypothetical protein